MHFDVASSSPRRSGRVSQLVEELEEIVDELSHAHLQLPAIFTPDHAHDHSSSIGSTPSPPAHPGPIDHTAPASIQRVDHPAAGPSGTVEPEQESIPLRIHHLIQRNEAVVNTFIAGGLAGATSRTVVSPLERIKILQQVQAATAPKAVPVGGAQGITGQAYTSVWASLVRIWKAEGFKGFMKGNGINVVRILPYSAIQFTLCTGRGPLETAPWSGTDVLSTPLRLLSGATAGIAAVSVTYPLDLVRARLSIATANMARSKGMQFTAEDATLGIVGMTKKVYRTEGGIKALYRGCWATAVGVAPYVSLNFYIYETVKPLIIPPGFQPSSDAELVGRKLLSGALAGGTSLLFTHPFDVVRRKLQVVGIGGGEREFTGAIDCIKKTVAREGFWKGMYRGLTPNIIKVVPSIAVSFYTFETVKDTLSMIAKWG